jgi:hypothetical protein
MPWLERLGWRLPAAIVLLAAVARVVRWLQTAVMMNDGPVFIRLARQIRDGDWNAALSYEFHPLYPIAIALVQPLFGDWERAAVAVSVIAGALSVLALYVLLRAAFDRRVAVVGAFLLAVHPIAIEQADVQSDPLYLAFFVWSAALLWRALSRHDARAAFAAGVVAGIAYLVRPEGLGAVIVGAIVLAWQLARRELRFPRAARVAVALCLGAVLAIAPYVAFISAHNGAFTLTGKKSVAGVLGITALHNWFTRGTVEYKPPKPVDPLLAERPDLEPPARGVRPFRNAPVTTGFAKDPAAAKSLLGVSLKAVRPEIAILLAFGLFAARGRPGQRGCFFAVYTGLYAFVLLGLAANSSYVSRRHVLPVATLLFGYAALGVPTLAAAIGAIPGLRGRFATSSVATALLVVVSALALGKALGPDRESSVTERRAAEWIAAHGALAPGEAVASVKQRVAYYADAPHVDLRRAPHTELLLAYLRREHARYVVVDDEERVEFDALVEGERDAVKLRHTEQGDGYGAFVYEVR